MSMNAHAGTLVAVALGLTLFASVAAAQFEGLPDPLTSSVDAIGVGDNLGVAQGSAPRGFDVAVRNHNGGPVLGTVVALDFSQTNVRAYATQNAGTTVNAAAHTLSRVATIGTTTFASRTARFDNVGLIAVSANGIQLGTAKWRSLDLDGADGTIGLGDIAYFASRYLRGVIAPECNFDGSASDVPDLVDLGILASEAVANPPVAAYAW
jgi:hypothetical protein